MKSYLHASKQRQQLIDLASELDAAAEILDISDRDYATEVDRVAHILRLRARCGSYDEMIAEIAATEAARAARYITNPDSSSQLSGITFEKLAAALKERSSAQTPTR